MGATADTAAAQVQYINNAIIQPSIQGSDAFLTSIAAALTDVTSPIKMETGNMPGRMGRTSSGNLPSAPSTNFPSRSGPTPPSITRFTLSVPNEPQFNAVLPNITDPTLPQAFNGTLPTNPSLDQISVPLQPTITYPVAPVLSTNLTLPTMPQLNYLDFTEEFPEFNDLAPDIPMFEYTEAEYLSSLSNVINSKLETDIVAGGSPLDPSVEDAIWDRDLERSNLALQENLDRALSLFSGRGLGLPSGTLARLADEIYDKDSMDKKTRSREIAIKQAEIARDHLHFCLEKGISFETLLREHFHRVAERALAASKAYVEMGVALYNARVNHYNSMISAYEASVKVYEARIRAELSKVEIYKAQIEGEKLKVDLQQSLVDLYKSQLEAVNILVNVYNSELAGAKLKLDLERFKVEIFRSEIDGFSASVQAKAAEYQLYQSQIDGQVAKIKVYDSQAQVFNTKVQSYKADLETRVEKYKGENDFNRLEIEKYNMLANRWKLEYDAEIAKINAEIAKYGHGITAYGHAIGVDINDAQLVAKEFEMRIEEFKGNLQIKMKEAIARIEQLQWAANMRLRASETGEKIYGTRLGHAISSISSMYQLYAGETLTGEVA